MCGKSHPKPTFLRVKGLARPRMVKHKIPSFTRCSTYSDSDDKISSQRELKKMELCMYFVNYYHYVCAKYHPNRTTFSKKRLERKKIVEPQSTNFTRCTIFFAPNDRLSSQAEFRKLKLCMWLVNYYHYACAKIQQNRTIFSVKGLARRKVAQPKKHRYHEMLDLLCFQSKNLESRGM